MSGGRDNRRMGDSDYFEWWEVGAFVLVGLVIGASVARLVLRLYI